MPSHTSARRWARPTRGRPSPGTVRNLFGTDIERNAIHGSDSKENAEKEIAFFFAEAELI